MRKFESNKVSCVSDGSLAITFVVLIDSLIDSWRLQVAMISLSEEQHLVFLFANLFVCCLIFSELRQNILRSEAILDGAVWRCLTKLVKDGAKSFNCCHGWWWVQCLLAGSLVRDARSRKILEKFEAFQTEMSGRKSRWRYLEMRWDLG